jgi:hypothetical protein
VCSSEVLDAKFLGAIRSSEWLAGNYQLFSVAPWVPWLTFVALLDRGLLTLNQMKFSST